MLAQGSVLTSENPRGEGQHLGAGEIDELSDPGDGHHLETHGAGLGVGDEDVDHAGKINNLKRAIPTFSPPRREVSHLGLINDMRQEFPQQIVAEGGDLGTRIIQNVEERIQKLREVLNHLRVRDTVQQADPGDQELSGGGE